MWAFSRLEENNVNLLNAVGRQARLKMHTFNAQNVANTASSPARLL